MSKLLLLTGAALVALLAASPSAWACSCAGPEPGKERQFYKQALKRSDGEIVAKVRNVRVVESGSGDAVGEQAVFTLRVRRAFKRFRQFPKGRILRIKTSNDSASCGLGMRRGQVGGLFLHRFRGRLTSSLCSRVTPRRLRRAARDRGNLPRRSESPAPPTGCGAA